MFVKLFDHSTKDDKTHCPHCMAINIDNSFNRS